MGKYRIERKIGEGGFANVYQAFDSIEGIRVAVKVPHSQYLSDELLDSFRQEIRLVAKLDHPNVIGIKDANFIEGRFVIVSRLGQQTLETRLSKRISVVRAVDYCEQMLSAVAYAHQQGVVHCDIKPENFIIFPDNEVRLTDFGIAKVTRKTIEGSGTGTVGHMSPEQAMGKPSFRSDVFSLGLIFFRILSGHWPQYPFKWPPVGSSNLRRKRVSPDLIALIRKSIEFNPRMRFADAISFKREFDKILPKVRRRLTPPRN